MKILSSASRIVFILLTITACIAFYKSKMSEGNFMILISAAFTYYFTKPATNPTP